MTQGHEESSAPDPGDTRPVMWSEQARAAEECEDWQTLSFRGLRQPTRQSRAAGNQMVRATRLSCSRARDGAGPPVHA
ncbi:hypothetical protein GCM10020227_07030 [Streptomyces flavovirens]